MKKLLFIVLALAMVVSICSCGENIDNFYVSSQSVISEPDTSETNVFQSTDCEHSYSLLDSVERTCTENGQNVYVCTICQASYTEQSLAFGHVWIPATSKAPKTCRTCGITEGTPLEYDEVLASGDGYYLVKKEEETYNFATTKYGVIDESGNWICPLSDENGFAICANDVMEDWYNQYYGELEISYVNEDMFVVKSYCALVEEGGIPSGYETTYATHCRSFIVSADGDIITDGEYMMTKFYDGYCFSTNKFGEVTRIDKEGKKVYLANRRSHTQWGLEELDVPSCGLIYCNNAFYDINTCEIAIDLSQYQFSPNTIRNARRFSSNGTFTFYFYNPNHNEYVATIDTNGDFVEPPKQR